MAGFGFCVCVLLSCKIIICQQIEYLMNAGSIGAVDLGKSCWALRWARVGFEQVKEVLYR